MERVLLNDVGEITKLAGFEFTKYMEYIPYGDIIAIRALNLKDGRLKLDDVKRISSDVSEKLPRSQLHIHDIVLSYTGTLGECAQIKEEGRYHLAPNVAKITPRDNIDPDYLFQIIRSPHFRQEIKNYAHGSTQPTIPMKALRELPIDVLPIEQQHVVAAILGKLDEKIVENELINKNLQTQAQSIYTHMIIDKAEESCGNGVLSDIATITMGQSPKGDTYNEGGTGTVFFQGRAEFGFRFPTRRLYTTDPKRMAQANDVLMSVRAPVGDLNVAYEDCCIGRGLGAIHSKDNHQSFVLYTMFALRDQLDVFNGEGTVFGSINRDALKSMPVIIPSREVVDKFENIVSPMDAEIRNNYVEICHLQAIRDSLLPRLMSGELDVSDVDL